MSDGMSKVSDAQKRAQERWNSENLERLSISFKKGHRDLWERASRREGKTLTAWVLETLDDAAEDVLKDDA